MKSTYHEKLSKIPYIARHDSDFECPQSEPFKHYTTNAPLNESSGKMGGNTSNIKDERLPTFCCVV
jgi:hypothetical protein